MPLTLITAGAFTERDATEQLGSFQSVTNGSASCEDKPPTVYLLDSDDLIKSLDIKLYSTPGISIFIKVLAQIKQQSFSLHTSS